MPTPTYDLISTTTLSSATTSVTLSSIPGTYRDLAFSIEGTTVGSSSYYIGLTTSASSGSYNYIYINASTSGANGGASGDNKIQIPAHSNYWSSTYTTIVFGEVLDYAQTSMAKNIFIRSGVASNVATELSLGLEPSTNAITSLTFAIGNSVTQFASGCIFTLYGIAG